MKYLVLNLTKYVQETQEKSYQILMKYFKDELNKLRDLPGQG